MTCKEEVGPTSETARSPPADGRPVKATFQSPRSFDALCSQRKVIFGICSALIALIFLNIVDS